MKYENNISKDTNSLQNVITFPLERKKSKKEKGKEKNVLCLQYDHYFLHTNDLFLFSMEI